MGIFSFIRKVEDRLHPIPLKERIAEATIRLHTQLEKLDHMYSRLKQRDHDLFQRCVAAQLEKDEAHSKMYANECAELRKMAKVVLGSQLALEKVIIRLETIEEFGNLAMQMAPVMSIVKETKSKIAGIVPQVATELEEVNDTLADLTNEATPEIETSLPIEANDSEARKILEETGVIVDQKLRDHFPDLPTFEPSTSPTTAPILEPATSAGTSNGNLQEQVYDYAIRHNGQFSIHICAKDLGTSPEAIQGALGRLRDTGKIEIE